ncbi:MAG: oligosaccharide flippase family protein, partial [Clostridia bacterium]|nr:oligosaccharide flippase family protein [Clostridia bacterium]
MAKEQGKKEFIKGAVWIAFGGFTAKLIGALYRIPLTNLIGGRGLGLYQMIYPVYCLLLTVSATGIPSSIAKLTAERIGKDRGDHAVFKSAMKLFLLIGLAGTVLMALIAPFLARAQGIKEVTAGYFTLAPSVFLVSAISVFRGWFQGRNKMYPTALSEIVEQLVKVGVGLLFAYLYRGNVEKAVVFLLLSVTVSEAAALLLML